MRRPSLVTLVLAVAPALSSGGCSSPSTLLTLDADPLVKDRLDAYCVALGGDGERRFGRRYTVDEHPLPQSLGVRSDGRSDGAARIDGLTRGVRIASQGRALGFDLERNPLALTACEPAVPRTTLSSWPAKAVVADRLIVVRTGAELGGTAELVALAGTDGARYRFEGSNPVELDAPRLFDGAGSSVAQLATADVDGDCGDDLIVAADDRSPLVWPGAANGDFVPDESRLAATPAARGLAVADLDADGWADLVAVGEEGATLLVSDQGRGFLEQPGAFSPSPAGASAVALGDIDQDGAIDAVIGFPTGGPLWMRNDGKGRLTLAGTLPGSFAVTALVLQDIDGDKDLDLIATVRNGAPGLRVFANNGGTFTEITATTVPSGLEASFTGLVTGDLDGDCRDDVVAIGATGPPRWLGWSSGNLVDRGPVGTQRARGGAIGDLDGDGILDLALAGPELVVYSTGAVSP